MYLEEIVSRLALSLNSFKTDFEKNVVKLSKQIINSTGVMKNDIETMKASIFGLGDKLNQLATHVLKMKGKGKRPVQPNHANVSAITLRSGKILNKNDDISLS